MVDNVRRKHVSEEARRDLQETLLHLVRLAGSPNVRRILLGERLSCGDIRAFTDTLNVASWLVTELWDWLLAYKPSLVGEVVIEPLHCWRCEVQVFPPPVSGM
ncbi:hypothetical protein Psi02_59530 [Planotetraspora silvatica]|uniref:Uncharacterized protein n=1 Tax=Planotetraspora silvatica TaxID=234614 RepID=A0A8J3UW74_9ACTN|nr:hypothetical protein [Planotetraspora silvatica]GII49529.1 hypothetical protein Psi02_59530 [Planotetraspora silvatica]